MSQTNLQIITDAFTTIGVLGAGDDLAPELGQQGLKTLNDLLANEAADGMRLGWYPQTDLYATAPLRDQDIFGVQLILAEILAPKNGISLEDPVLLAQIADARRQLTKRSIRYFESDLGELQRPQASPWGGAGFFL